MPKKDPRDMIGYGSRDQKIKWPNNARIAVQIVLNYEEGAENCVLNGDNLVLYDLNKENITLEFKI